LFDNQLPNSLLRKTSLKHGLGLGEANLRPLGGLGEASLLANFCASSLALSS